MLLGNPLLQVILRICILLPILENPSFLVALIWYLIRQPLYLLSFWIGNLVFYVAKGDLTVFLELKKKKSHNYNRKVFTPDQPGPEVKQYKEPPEKHGFWEGELVT